MGEIILFILFLWGLYAALCKSDEIAARADDRRRQARRVQPPKSAKPPRQRGARGLIGGTVHRHQHRHDADCRAKIRRAEARGNPRSYYVYEHVDPSGRVRYVGHGKSGRAWSRARASRKHRELLDRGELQVRVVERGLTARDAVQREAERLDRRGRDGSPLFNKLRGTRL
ncbi:hypothetical protein OAG01_00275 [bacterium]|nr:hypothetical protein [bacterium]MDA7668769.1 hypothetical protein [bacterium]MDB4632861.1 hypothetical protein [bacterium]